MRAIGVTLIIISMLIGIGAVGALELNTITIIQALLLSAVCAIVGSVGLYIGYKGELEND